MWPTPLSETEREPTPLSVGVAGGVTRGAYEVAEAVRSRAAGISPALGGGGVLAPSAERALARRPRAKHAAASTTRS